MMNDTTKLNGLISKLSGYYLFKNIFKNMKQVIITFSVRRLVAYGIGIQYWCKNKGLIKCGNVIVLYISHI